MMSNAISKFKFILNALIKKIQAILLFIFLGMIYFIGIGLTKVLLLFFSRELLKVFFVNKEQATYWHEAKGYENTKENSLRQF